MKQRPRNDYPTIELLEEEVERRQDRARETACMKNVLLVVLAILWAIAVLR